MKPSVYLAGPIDQCSDDECKAWRTYVKATFFDFDWRDPMDRDYRGRETECVTEIVCGDKVDISHSHAVLVHFTRPSVGTAMEIYYAWTLSLPIVVVVPAGKPVSPWLRYHATVIVPTMDRAIEALTGFLVMPRGKR